MAKTKKQPWYDYLWLASILYLCLGFFNILFAWLGMICFLTPLGMAIFGKEKAYCNRYCGRGQLLGKLGKAVSMHRPIPKWLYSKGFRYGFLAFFMFMFCSMIFSTYLVFAGSKNLQESITLLWTFSLPWQFASSSAPVADWVKQFAFGFYSVMVTSTVLGIGTMVFFRPRTWCVYCPMGTMTQMICKAKAKEKV